MKEEELDKLDQYLQGGLSAEERKEIENGILNDAQIREAFTEMKMLQAGIQQAGRRQLQQELKHLEAGLPPLESSVVPLWRNVYWQAAAVVMAAALVFILLPAKPSSEELFASTFEPYPNIIMPTVRGEQRQDTTLLALAYQAYDRNEFEAAISSFEQVQQKDAAVFLYLGNCYLTTGRVATAKTNFEKALDISDVFDEQARWFLALAHLKLNEIDSAKAQLQRLVQVETSYADKAKDLLNKL